MKKLFYVALAVIMLSGGFYSCDDDYDDTELWEQTNENTEAIEELQTAIQALQTEIDSVKDDLDGKADLASLTELVDDLSDLADLVAANDTANQAALAALRAELIQIIEDRIALLQQTVDETVGEDIDDIVAELQALKELLGNLSEENLTIFYYDYMEAQVMPKSVTGDWSSIAPTINDEDGAEAEYRIIGVRKFNPDIHPEPMRQVPAGNGGNGGTVVGDWWLEYFEGWDDNPWFEIDKYTGIITPIDEMDIPVGEYIIGVMAIDRKNIGCCDFLAIRTIEFESVKDLDVVLDPMAIEFRLCGDADDIDWDAVLPYTSPEVDLIHIFGPYSGSFLGIDNEVNDFRIVVEETCEFEIPCHRDTTYNYDAVFKEEIDEYNFVTKPFSVTILPRVLEGFDRFCCYFGTKIYVDTCNVEPWRLDLNNYIECEERAVYEIVSLNGVDYDPENPDDPYISINDNWLEIINNDRRVSWIYDKIGFDKGSVAIEIKATDYLDPSVSFTETCIFTFKAYDRLLGLEEIDDLNFDEGEIDEIDIDVYYDHVSYWPKDGDVEIESIVVEKKITDSSDWETITNPFDTMVGDDFEDTITLTGVDDIERGTYKVTLTVRDMHNTCGTATIMFYMEIDPGCCPTPK